MSASDWLAAACAEALKAGASGAEPVDVRVAEQLGARAADSGVTLRDLVAAVLAAATATWADEQDDRDTHAHAAALLATVRTTLDAAIAGHERSTHAELARNDIDRAAFVNDLLTGRADPGVLAQRAHRYGIRLAATHTVLVVRAPDLTPEIAHRVDAALAGRFGDGNTLTTLRQSDLVCISAGGLRGVPAELAHLLLQALGAGRWQIGVGRTHPGVQGLAASLDEARNALDLAAKLGFTAPVLNAADLLVFPVLLRDRDAITDLVTTVLGPLREARGGPQPYLDTLTVLFDNQGNYTATARHMHLSVRAVTYRLDRIQSLTGYHPGEPTQRFTLQAAVLGARLLGWPAG
ncbi:helix-turn-helix domain-containing protein [Hamadaea sp. NPDC050747]|uniref:PucR family transcriptional regulator n=1 Tax=Hamadaea sp. NPDC050747 TaxID=3155789 RepID=UPI0034073B42